MLRVKQPCVYVLVPLVSKGMGALWLDYSGARCDRCVKDIDIPTPAEVYHGTVGFVVFWIVPKPDCFGVEDVIGFRAESSALPWWQVWGVAKEVDVGQLSSLASTYLSGLYRVERADAQAEGAVRHE